MRTIYGNEKSPGRLARSLRTHLCPMSEEHSVATGLGSRSTSAQVAYTCGGIRDSSPTWDFVTMRRIGRCTAGRPSAHEAGSPPR